MAVPPYALDQGIPRPPSFLSRLFGWHRIRDLPGIEVTETDGRGYAMIKNRVLYINEKQRTFEYAHYLYHKHHADPYYDNTVRTSKYTWINFIPKSLFEQFRRIANLYFLVISLLQLFTGLSPTNEYSTIGPLTIVLIATMLKEGMEDKRRHQQDHFVNHQRIEVLNAMENHANTVSHPVFEDENPNANLAGFQSVYWKQLRVGHVIRLYENDQIPADIVVLASSHSDGQAMCETASLDGESNLKIRHSVKWNQVSPRTIQDFGTMITGEIRCELPNKRLYTFDGVVKLTYRNAKSKSILTQHQNLNGPFTDSEEIPITIDNVLLRGMKLCNTKWILGVVVGAGHDTKLIQNMKAIPSKFSRLDHIANRCIVLIFSVLFAVCCISSIQSSLYTIKITSHPEWAKELLYIKPFRSYDFLELWITYLILYNNMVPISLYISLEVVKWYQARRIENDPQLQCNGMGVTARTSNVNEDLGQIQYIFSDKTGTLTRNQMLFKGCSIGGIIYDGTRMHLRRMANATSPELSETIPSLGENNPNSREGPPGTPGSSNGSDNRRTAQRSSSSERQVRPYYQLPKMMEKNGRSGGVEQQSIELARPFFRCLLLCHSASVSVDSFSSPTIEQTKVVTPVPDGRSDPVSGNSERISTASALGPLPSLHHSNGRGSSSGASFSGDAAEIAANAEAEEAANAAAMAAQAYNLKYWGSSPDEVALLNAATEFQCVFEARDGDLIHIRLFGERETYRLLAQNEFDSVRKCMSVVVQRIEPSRSESPGDSLSELENEIANFEKDEILVFCKGADTVMLANACNSVQDINKLGLHVHYFATMALRTLLLGYRSLSKHEYREWKTEYDIAKKSLSQREYLCIEAAKKIETSIELLGATAVEDLLQDGVRETIDQLVQAGVNVWMLTGDKDETAISVAHMCGLIDEKSKIVIIKGKTKQDCLDEIANARRKLKRDGMWVPGLASRNVSLVINGEALDHLLSDAQCSISLRKHGSVVHNGLTHVLPANAMRLAATFDFFIEESTSGTNNIMNRDIPSTKSASSLPMQHPRPSGPGSNSGATKQRVGSRHGSTRPSMTDSHLHSQYAHVVFMELATQCSSVVACRLSPMQKAQVVSLMKCAPGAPLTLAIGDGGNDVSMIQEAHVGIGIYGHEGMQAVRAADFAIVTFRHLSRLLLVHGRWNHRRVARVILFSFYKNMTLIMTLFAYSLKNGYSGQTLYESYLMVGWNVLYTVLPIFVLGIVDEDIRDRAVLKYPFVYRSSLKICELSLKKLAIWVFNALVHSVFVYFFSMGTLGYMINSQGHTNGLFTDGTAVYGALVVTVTLKGALTMQRLHRWTWGHYLSLIGGFLIYLVFVLCYSHAYHVFPSFTIFRDFYGIATMLFDQTTFWILLCFTSITSIAPDLAIMYLKQMYLPSSDDIIQEIDSGLGEHFRLEPSTIASSVLAQVNRKHRMHLKPSCDESSSDTGRTDMTASLLDGEWSQKFRDFDQPSEHDELSKLLISVQRDIAQELGLPDPILREEDSHNSKTLHVQPSVHPLTLEFMGEEHVQLEQEYELAFAFRERMRVNIYLKILVIVVPMYAFYEYHWENDQSKYPIRAGFLLGVIGFMRFVRTKFFLQNYQMAMCIPYCIMGIVLTLTISDTGKFAAALFPICLFVVIRVKFLNALMLSIFNLTFYLLADKLGLKVDASTTQFSDLLLFTFYLAFVISFGAFSCYSLQTTMRRDFLQSRSLLLEQKRSTQILKNMLPEHVVKRMQKGETVISEDEKDVSILFCDIADFASFVKRLSPTEVVSLLDRVYSLFDQICEKHGVRKMETVGKTYMACAGLQGKDRGKEAALRAVSMAYDMLSCLDRCRTSTGSGIKLRIGIHSGRVISGLVGMKKQQFSLFGDTVNTASRMQSTGITGRCQISQATYKKLVSHFEFEERQVQVKGKGSMTTYLLGEPLTEVAKMAVAGHLELIIKRDSVINEYHGRKMPFDPDFLSATTNKFVRNARKRWARLDFLPFLIGSPPNSMADLDNPNSNLAAISEVEEDMLREIHAANLRFKDDEMEYKYCESTLTNRIEGARTTLYVLAIYAVFATLRDLTIAWIQTTSLSSYTITSEMYSVITIHRLVYGLIAAMIGRHARPYFPEYSEIAMRNILLSAFLMGLIAFCVPEIWLWSIDFSSNYDSSVRYVNLCLDTVLVLFVVSNGGSILHRHSVSFNILAFMLISATSILCLDAFPPSNKLVGFNIRFKTSYPIVLTGLSCMTNIMASQSVEFFTRRQIWLKTRTQFETMNADRLLYQMLPAAVVMRLKEGETVCDQHQQVGILFSDIKGFTSIASEANPTQVVNILASLFTSFDKLTEKHGVFKMQTIGDAYVIVSGLPYVDMSLGPLMSGGSMSAGPLTTRRPSLHPSHELANAERKHEGPLVRRSTLKQKFQMHIRSHIRDLLAMARDMHKEVRKVNDPNTGERLQMRIGIHIGNIIGGVIGTRTLRYDMWGPDALTANELESNGVPEHTLVSPVVMEVVKGMPDIKCTFYKKIDFTNMSMMDTYLVEFVDPNEGIDVPPATPSSTSINKENPPEPTPYVRRSLILQKSLRGLPFLTNQVAPTPTDDKH